ncbi:hypothetical protein HDF16_004991 [Granulicella aggregans]|uniref:Uncharacterized protein n=1 Tax=Granulicella aggregans TaxID=474949 RepID=A0A7W7ZHX6_9BACT|nr:hypothetical protein [Granulicella aggregans]MBB5060255.1 hypothetical protein [Granulicella aggregans]
MNAQIPVYAGVDNAETAQLRPNWHLNCDDVPKPFLITRNPKGLETWMTLLLMQMTVVLLVALLCGWVARKLGQARVIGEIVVTLRRVVLRVL